MLPVARGTIHHFEDVPAGPPKTFVVNCPPGYISTNGGLSPQNNPAIRLTVSVPGPGVTGWTFTVVNTIGPPGPGRNVTAAVIVTCVKPTPPPAVPPIKTRVGKGKAILANPGRIKVVITPFNGAQEPVTCPKGSTPVGETVKTVAPKGAPFAQAASLGSIGDVQITRLWPKGRTLEFGVRNPTATDQSVRLGVVCLRKWVRTTAGPMRIQRSTARFGVSVQPGDQSFGGRCKGGAILHTGFSLPSDGGVSLLGVNPGRERVGIALGNHTDLAQPAEVALTCASGTVGFIRGK